MTWGVGVWVLVGVGVVGGEESVFDVNYKTEKKYLYSLNHNSLNIYCFKKKFSVK